MLRTAVLQMCQAAVTKRKAENDVNVAVAGVALHFICITWM